MSISAQTILIVDDDPANLTVLNTLLSSEYKVRAANSGRRALEMANLEPRPDLILLDIIMPEMDGYSVLKKLKDNPITNPIPVIFLTAMGSDEKERKGLQLGAVDYIIKPIKPLIMLARVKAQLNLKFANDFLHNKNDFLESEVSRRMEENQLIQNASILALAHLAETRDPETGEHIKRTQTYIELLAKKLQNHPRFENTLTNHFISLLVKSAPLHDIGKVGIPDNILLKPGPLNEDEWKVMKTHAEIGAHSIELTEDDISQPIEFLSLSKDIAHWHHERWDGEGYPDGLTGDNIPLSARFMAVADVFDAITSKRIYKEAMPFIEAKKIIICGRGKHFDPDIVDAFVELFEDFCDVARQFQSDS
jgi:putative two-component system response regulator